MTYFKFPIIGQHEAMTTDLFFKWLDANVAKGDSFRDIELLTRYLTDEYGFKMGEDFIQEDHLDTLHYIAETWYRVTPWGPPMRVSEAFPSVGEFYVSGTSERQSISQTLRELVEKSGWIYGLTPDTTYFEITRDGRLFAKYQQILGSRYLCNILDWSK